MKLRELLEDKNFATVYYTKGTFYGYSAELFRLMLEEIQKIGTKFYLIEMAINDWKNFNFTNAKKIINSFNDRRLKAIWSTIIPYGTKEAKKLTKQIRDTSTKLPKKELKLK